MASSNTQDLTDVSVPRTQKSLGSNRLCVDSRQWGSVGLPNSVPIQFLSSQYTKRPLAQGRSDEKGNLAEHPISVETPNVMVLGSFGDSPT